MTNTPQKHYFKIKTGFKPHEFVICDELEVEKAYYAFLFDAKTIINGRPVKGTQILDILPHYNRNLGYADEYVFGSDPEDYRHAEREGVMRLYQGVQNHIQARVTHLVETNQKNLIGKGVDIPQLKAPEGKRIEGVSELAAKMNINHVKG